VGEGLNYKQAPGERSHEVRVAAEFVQLRDERHWSRARRRRLW